jgi:hypothetical protein
VKPKHRVSPTVFGVLEVLSDLIRGGLHSRRTVVRGWRVSLPTADRWLASLELRVPGVTSTKVGREKWLGWRQTKRSPDGP